MVSKFTIVCLHKLRLIIRFIPTEMPGKCSRGETYMKKITVDYDNYCYNFIRESFPGVVFHFHLPMYI